MAAWPDQGRAAALDAWLRDLAPSDELRKWFHAHPQQWSKFREKYLKELRGKAAHDALEQLYALEKKRRLTLLFASKNEEHNNATVLKQLIEGDRKPPTGTGPLRAVAKQGARAARRG